MPDITELLHDAAPSARPFDESALRRRVGVRRRRRVGALVAAVVVVVAGLGGAAFLAADPPGESVVAEEGPAASVPTALALVDDELWTAGDGWVASPSAERFEVPGPVRQLAAGDLLWAAGDTWVTAIDTAGGDVLGRWSGQRVADVQPLPERRLALTEPDTGRVVVLRFGADGLVVAQSILVIGQPTNLVLTLGEELWVNDGDVICSIDYDGGTAVEERTWSGSLLAASGSGGIWTTDGARVVDLHPLNLDAGVSVAQGDRYEVTATMAVDTAAGLYVGGPDGLSRHDAEGGEIVDVAVPDALVGSDTQVVYLVDGEVRRAHAEDPRQAEVDAFAEQSEQLTRMLGARQADERFVRAELGWVDGAMGEGIASDDQTVFTQTATSSSLGQTVELYHDMVDGWRLTAFTTFVGQDNHGATNLGTGDDLITFDFDDPALTPELRVTYGGSETVLRAERGGKATWSGDLGYVPDLPGTVWVLWRDDDGVVVEGLGYEVPAGPLAAG